MWPWLPAPLPDLGSLLVAGLLHLAFGPRGRWMWLLAWLPGLCGLRPWLVVFAVPSHAVASAVGLVVAWVWLRRRSSYPEAALLRIALVLMPLAASGAIGLYYLTDPAAPTLGGAIFYGALYPCLLAWPLVCRWQQLSALSLAQAAAAPLLLAQAIGRLGCQANGCCFGQGGWGLPLPALVWFPTLDTGGYLQGTWVDGHAAVRCALLHLPWSEQFLPVPLLESAGCLLLSATVAWRGLGAGAALAGYALLRCALEFVRGDTLPWGGLTLGQWLSFPVFALGLWLCMHNRTTVARAS